MDLGSLYLTLCQRHRRRKRNQLRTAARCSILAWLAARSGPRFSECLLFHLLCELMTQSWLVPGAGWNITCEHPLHELGCDPFPRLWVGSSCCLVWLWQSHLVRWSGGMSGILVIMCLHSDQLPMPTWNRWSEKLALLADFCSSVSLWVSIEYHSLGCFDTL